MELKQDEEALHEKQKDVSELKEYFSSLSAAKGVDLAEKEMSISAPKGENENSQKVETKQKGSILKRLAAKFSPKVSKREIKEDSGSNDSSQKTDPDDAHIDNYSSYSDR